MRVDVDEKEQLAPDLKHEAQPDKVEALQAEHVDIDPVHEVVDHNEHLDEAAAHYAVVADLLDQVLNGADVDEEGVAGLSEEERDGIDAMESAVIGRDRKADQIIYAEDRLDLLNRALAVLQPTLAVALLPELEQLRDQFDSLVERVGDLRDHLEQLDGAQEEIFEQDREEAQGDDAPDEDDGDDEEAPAEEPPAGEGEPAEKDDKKADNYMKRWRKKPAARPASPPSPPMGEPGSRPSTLAGGPGEPAVEQPARPSTLAGKAGEPAVELPSRPSTLAGKAGEPAVELPVRPSSVLDGPPGKGR